MAHITASAVASLAAELLTRSVVLAGTVARVPAAEIGRGAGDTVTVRVRVPRTAREQVTPGAPIDFDEIHEHSIDVTLHHYYDAARLTDEDTTLNLADFGRQVTEPQIASVAAAAEATVAAVLNGIAPSIAIDDTDPHPGILQARTVLTRADVPAGDRWLAVSPEVAEVLLNSDKVSKVDASGSPSALRDAVIGRLFSFNIVESPGLTAGRAVAYHRTAAVFATAPPAAPRGAGDTATVNTGEVALRQLFDYDARRLSDRSIVSVFAGCAPYLDADTPDDPESTQSQQRAVALQLPTTSS